MAAPEHTAEYWIKAAGELLDRAERVRVEDSELSEALFLIAQSTTTLARGITAAEASA